jgi:hypothetical protein
MERNITIFITDGIDSEEYIFFKEIVLSFFYNILMHILFKLSSKKMNHFCGVMSSMLISSSVDPGFEPWSVKPKTIKFVFVASPLGTRH